jgi:hypothetical protein
MISLPFEQYASSSFFDDIRKNEGIGIIFQNYILKIFLKKIDFKLFGQTNYPDNLKRAYGFLTGTYIGNLRLFF